MRIRASRPEDGARIVEIWRAAVDATHDFLALHDRVALDTLVCDVLPSAPLWLAVDGADHALGFLLVDDGHIEALFVDPVAHGQGIGRALVGHALRLHPAATTDVNAQNVLAIGFYETMGFVPEGRSEVDGQGRPYPLIHLRFAGAT